MTKPQLINDKAAAVINDKATARVTNCQRLGFNRQRTYLEKHFASMANSYILAEYFKQWLERSFYVASSLSF